MPPVLALAALLAAAPPAGPDNPVDERKVRRALSHRDTIDRAGIAAAGGYGPAAFPLYHRILADPGENLHVVTRVLVILAEPNMKGDKAPFLDPAAAFLTHQHPRIRRTAVEMIGAIGTARDAAPVVAMLWDEDTTFSAAKALAAIGDRRTADAMEVWLKRGNHRDKEDLRRRVEGFRADLLDRLKKEEDARKAHPPAK